MILGYRGAAVQHAPRGRLGRFDASLASPLSGMLVFLPIWL